MYSAYGCFQTNSKKRTKNSKMRSNVLFVFPESEMKKKVREANSLNSFSSISTVSGRKKKHPCCVWSNLELLFQSRTIGHWPGNHYIHIYLFEHGFRQILHLCVVWSQLVICSKVAILAKCLCTRSHNFFMRCHFKQYKKVNMEICTDTTQLLFSIHFLYRN